MACASPYNNRIEQTARGRHALRYTALCLFSACEGRAGNPPHLSLPGQALRPCSLLIRALYGLCDLVRNPSKN